MKNTITEIDIDNSISKKEFFKLGEKTTICLLTLKNKFELTGVSACVDVVNFNKEIGEKIAFENAKEKIWQLEGYKLQCELEKS